MYCFYQFGKMSEIYLKIEFAYALLMHVQSVNYA